MARLTSNPPSSICPCPAPASPSHANMPPHCCGCGSGQLGRFTQRGPAARGAFSRQHQQQQQHQLKQQLHGQRHPRRHYCSSSGPWRPPRLSSGSSAAAAGPPDAAPDASRAWALLQDFTSKEFRGLARPMLASKAGREQLRAALLVAAAHPHPPEGWASPGETGVLLGVVASDARLAVRALRDWCQALGVPFAQPTLQRGPQQGGGGSSSSSSSSSSSAAGAGASLAAVPAGPVYVKYNSRGPLCYASPYRGGDRGVLLQLGQAQLGHFPLGLFDEGMANPPPPPA